MAVPFASIKLPSVAPGEEAAVAAALAAVEDTLEAGEVTVVEVDMVCLGPTCQ